MANTPKVIIADDEAHVRRVVAHKLSGAGYEVLTASDGREALEMCQRERPDLLIVDYVMPELNGLQVSKALGEDPATRSIQRILLTCHGHDLEPGQLESSGISMIIPKPFSPRNLLETIDAMLFRKAA